MSPSHRLTFFFLAFFFMAKGWGTFFLVKFPFLENLHEKWKNHVGFECEYVSFQP